MSRATYLAVTGALTCVVCLLILFCVASGAIPPLGGLVCVGALGLTCILRHISTPRDAS